MKRFLFCCLTIAILATCLISLPQRSNAAEQEADFTYYIDRGDVTITKWISPTQGDIVVPERVDGYRVTYIGDHVFEDCSEITSVTLPDTIISIGYFAFKNCCTLETINLPDSLRSIGHSAFFGCQSLTGVTLGDNLTEIGTYAFSGCAALTSIAIPDSVHTLGNAVFKDCANLQHVTVGDGVSAIGQSVFQNCPQLFAVEIGANVTSLGKNAFASDTSIFYVYYTGTKEQWGQILYYEGNDALLDAPFVYFSSHMPNPPVAPLPPENTPFSYRLKHGNAIITGYNEPLIGDVVIPEMLNGCPVTEIADDALSYCTEMTCVSIPDTIIVINNGVFCGCSSLERVIFPKGLLAIGDSAFSGCEKLSSVALGDNLLAIGNSAFSNCRALTEISIPDSVQFIDHSAFYRCAALKKVTLGSGLTAIADYTFAYCKSLETVVIAQNVQSIGKCAFFNCTDLFAVELGTGVTSIGKDAFIYNDLFYVYYAGTQQQWEHIQFDSGNESLTDSPFLYYTSHMPDPPVAPLPPEDTIFTYYLRHGEAIITGSKAPLVGDVVFPETLNGCPVIQIGGFSRSLDLTAITIPDSVRTLSEGAFQQCHLLRRVIGGNGITTIEDQAFFYCNHITQIGISQTVTHIGNAAFADCFLLTDVYYAGTQAQWEGITIEPDNEYLTNATIHFSSEPPMQAADVDRSGSVNTDDVIYLLQAILMPDLFRVKQPVDFNADGKQDEADVLCLLRHVLLPDQFPL